MYYKYSWNLKFFCGTYSQGCESRAPNTFVGARPGARGGTRGSVLVPHAIWLGKFEIIKIVFAIKRAPEHVIVEYTRSIVLAYIGRPGQNPRCPLFVISKARATRTTLRPVWWRPGKLQVHYP